MQAYWYDERHQKTVYSAETILSLLLPCLPPVRSAVDLGCGVGTWLSVLQARGAQEVLGFDGDWVDRQLLVIPQDCFRKTDLSRLESSGRRFDLAISLEVAEHLPAARAETFVQTLTSLSDFVLFSAAIPGQGGRNHVNEQWPDYWVEHFARENYEVHDFIRAQIWGDAGIPYWYRQNVLLFVRRERASELCCPEIPAAVRWPLRVVHPEQFERQVKAATSRRRVRLLPKAWKQYLKRRLRGTR